MFNIIKFGETDSTNSLMKLNIDKINNKDVYIAKVQKAGRGRLGHTFESPNGGLYMSVFLDAVYNTDEMPFVTVIAGFAVRRAIFDITGLDAKIKWPNDLFVHGKKVCGILTELVGKNDGFGTVIGIGLNINSKRALPNIATSILLETDKEYEIDLFAEKILYHLDNLYGKCDKHAVAAELRKNILKQSDEMNSWLDFYNL